MGKRKSSDKNQVSNDGTPKMQEQRDVISATPKPKKRKKKRENR